MIPLHLSGEIASGHIARTAVGWRAVACAGVLALLLAGCEEPEQPVIDGFQGEQPVALGDSEAAESEAADTPASEAEAAEAEAAGTEAAGTGSEAPVEAAGVETDADMAVAEADADIATADPAPGDESANDDGGRSLLGGLITVEYPTDRPVEGGPQPVGDETEGAAVAAAEGDDATAQAEPGIEDEAEDDSARADEADDDGETGTRSWLGGLISVEYPTDKPVEGSPEARESDRRGPAASESPAAADASATEMEPESAMGSPELAALPPVDSGPPPCAGVRVVLPRPSLTWGDEAESVVSRLETAVTALREDLMVSRLEVLESYAPALERFAVAETEVDAVLWPDVRQAQNRVVWKAFTQAQPTAVALYRDPLSSEFSAEAWRGALRRGLPPLLRSDSRLADDARVAPLHECDLAAADPNDDRRVAPGVPNDLLDPVVAFFACLRATELYPKSQRFRYQLARAIVVGETNGGFGRNPATAGFGDLILGVGDWFREGAEQGYPAAMVGFAYVLEQGLGVGRNKSHALSWYRRAAETGHPIALLALGRAYLTGDSVPRDAERGLAYYREAAATGSAAAETALGEVYEFGIGVDANPPLALEWYGKAADRGHPEALLRLAQIHDEGRTVPRDPAKARSLMRRALPYYETAASRGNPQVQYMLARFYATGFGVAPDSRQAGRWLLSAAEQGHADAQYMLGSFLEEGRGVPRNLEAARRWYERAMSNGSSKARDRLTAMEQG